MTDEQLAEFEALIEGDDVIVAADARMLVAEVRQMRDERALDRATLERCWDDGFNATVKGWIPREPMGTPSDEEWARLHAQRKEDIDRVLAERGQL